jgi:TIR domain
MKIFLSYSEPDKDIAESIAFSLRSRSHEVFLDRDDLPAGQSYDEQIEKAVQLSDIFIFLISPDSVTEGRYALTELKFARRKWKHPAGRVLPVMVRETPLDKIPAYLRAVTILRVSGNAAAETSAAVDKMKNPVPRGPILILVALCVIAAGLVYWLLTGGVTMVDCKEEPHLRSTAGNAPTSITFANNTDEPLQLYWLDYAGKRALVGTIEKGQTLTPNTYVTHPWIVANPKGECKAIYLPGSRKAEVNVSR